MSNLICTKFTTNLLIIDPELWLYRVIMARSFTNMVLLLRRSILLTLQSLSAPLSPFEQLSQARSTAAHSHEFILQ